MGNIVQCPFYEMDSKKVIQCAEGLNGCKIALVYGSAKVKAMQKECFCEGDFTKCDVFRLILERNYKEDKDIYGL